MSRVLYLIRHGRSDFGSRKMSTMPRGDQWDPPLSEEGRHQAELLAMRLRAMELHPTAVYCSPLRRARETVAPYAEVAGLEVTFDEHLIEAHIGGWEGLPFEEIISSDNELVRLLVNQQPIWHRSPGGETMPEFRGRVVTAIDGILTKYPKGDVVVVAARRRHQRVLR